MWGLRCATPMDSRFRGNEGMVVRGMSGLVMLGMAG